MTNNNQSISLDSLALTIYRWIVALYYIRQGLLLLTNPASASALYGQISWDYLALYGGFSLFIGTLLLVGVFTRIISVLAVAGNTIFFLTMGLENINLIQIIMAFSTIGLVFPKPDRATLDHHLSQANPTSKITHENTV